jgi:hypothetical protein
MSDIYQITLTTQTGESFTGKMLRRQPELVNGFVPLATETGEWLYFAPADVKRAFRASTGRADRTNNGVTNEQISTRKPSNPVRIRWRERLVQISNVISSFTFGDAKF